MLPAAVDGEERAQGCLEGSTIPVLTLEEPWTWDPSWEQRGEHGLGAQGPSGASGRCCINIHSPGPSVRAQCKHPGVGAGAPFPGAGLWGMTMHPDSSPSVQGTMGAACRHPGSPERSQHCDSTAGCAWAGHRELGCFYNHGITECRKLEAASEITESNCSPSSAKATSTRCLNTSRDGCGAAD